MSLLIGDRLDALRSAVTTSHRSQFRRLHEQCEWSARQVLPEQHPSASITWLGAGAPNLALAHLLTGQPWYLAELRRWLRATCALPHWGKEHMPDTDLDAGWLCFGLALVEDWVGHLLPADERSMLQAKLALQAGRLHKYIEENRGAWWADAYWQNHNWICYSGLAAVGYALPGHPRSGDWTAAAAANARELRRRLPADGADGEGVVYWRYGVPWLAAHADLMRTAHDPEGHNAFKDFDFLRQTFWYRLHQAAPGFETIINHGDCHDRRSGHSVALYYKLASEYGIGEAQWLANRVADQHFWREAYESGVRPGVMPEAYLEFLWFNETIEPASPMALPTGRSFSDLGLLATRTSWRDDANMVSVKASPGSGHGSWREGHALAASGKWQAASDGHSHPDMGAFVVIGAGNTSPSMRATAAGSCPDTTTWFSLTGAGCAVKAAITCGRTCPKPRPRCCMPAPQAYRAPERWVCLSSIRPPAIRRNSGFRQCCARCWSVRAGSSSLMTGWRPAHHVSGVGCCTPMYRPHRKHRNGGPCAKASAP
ncbi:hypothetical protein GU243_13580 [Pseudarthrobacter psychrotolerans]|uniref:DUF4962 domain-containing protein n=1 Tax=Pseudarthrobacter psychrotolerans TaxID=2697569 RepID=A0A6P1NUS7_9MICC|nr:hypothetical protein GU243_13580 [Pseudarthrobacter psychrotolerans]